MNQHREFQISWCCSSPTSLPSTAVAQQWVIKPAPMQRHIFITIQRTTTLYWIDRSQYRKFQIDWCCPHPIPFICCCPEVWQPNPTHFSYFNISPRTKYFFGQIGDSIETFRQIGSASLAFNCCWPAPLIQRYIFINSNNKTLYWTDRSQNGVTLIVSCFCNSKS